MPVEVAVCTKMVVRVCGTYVDSIMCFALSTNFCRCVTLFKLQDYCVTPVPLGLASKMVVSTSHSFVSTIYGVTHISMANVATEKVSNRTITVSGYCLFPDRVRYTHGV